MITRTKSTSTVAGLSVTEWPGTGPVVLGLPGLSSSATAWGPLAAALPGAHVVSIDLRGRGASRDVAGPPGLRAHAQDVAAVLAHLDLTDVTVVGHSMGAFLAPLVAQETPDRIRKLVLIDGGIRPKLPFFMGRAVTRLAFRKQLGSLDRAWPSVEAMAKKIKIDKMVASRPDLRPVLLQVLRDELVGEPGALRPRVDSRRCAEDAVDAFWGDDAASALTSLTVPTVLFVAENMKWDGQRPFIADDVIEPWRRKLPNLTVQRLPGNHTTVVFDPAVAAACTS
jgi:lipase